MEDPAQLAGLEPDEPAYDDAPLSILSVAYCDDAFFG
jgi:hypothetical protein